MIPYGKQEITEEDIQSVVEVLRSDFLTQGPKVPEFESAISRYCEVSFACAVNSATSALHIACLALDLGEGDWVWTSPNTFVASANCALYCGASIDFVDIDEKSYNLCAEKLAKKLKYHRKNSLPLPKVVIPVHFAGQSCDMDKIAQLSKEYGFHIIEDASHAIGGRYNEHRIGSCQFSNITVFSFHPVKLMTTAEGGILTTNDETLLKKMQLLRSHGITRDKALLCKDDAASWYYEQQILGYNYRMSDLHAALGISQLNRLDKSVARRNEIAKYFNSSFSDLGITLPAVYDNVYSAFHLYVIQVETEQRSARFEKLKELGLGVNLHYIPVHTQPYFRQLGFDVGDFPAAEEYSAKAITLPLFHSMSESQAQKVVEVVREVFG
ncbi:UDP-4-amino-4,6-dideoxy-N-acetyl-beta-L-altrosamine transaminase [Aliikangiella sp. G2MR2-5]|uniref:UDP-4-amino-4, 6-dideoxy-N-acetyl-beta-L-altrosamine transaminase n=1 Tax=Aliikangiella sp. G2MR2-5 TaxID=2788943 RepID=UPI0018AB6B98|nr:UDP-4-amino-4,6-dideoxy-N-acetyl-beta-L-altrosamine transaminase [Aliikangiella sp. G2MR2-5]